MEREQKVVTFADWLAARRGKRTLRQIEEYTGISAGAIRGLLQGARPHMESCVALARYFGDDPVYVCRLANWELPCRGAEEVKPLEPEVEELLSDPDARIAFHRLLDFSPETRRTAFRIIRTLQAEGSDQKG